MPDKNETPNSKNTPLVSIAAKDFLEDTNKSTRYSEAFDRAVESYMSAANERISKAVESAKESKNKEW